MAWKRATRAGANSRRDPLLEQALSIRERDEIDDALTQTRASPWRARCGRGAVVGGARGRSPRRRRTATRSSNRADTSRPSPPGWRRTGWRSNERRVSGRKPRPRVHRGNAVGRRPLRRGGASRGLQRLRGADDLGGGRPGTPKPRSRRGGPSLHRAACSWRARRPLSDPGWRRARRHGRGLRGVSPGPGPADRAQGRERVGRERARAPRALAARGAGHRPAIAPERRRRLRRRHRRRSRLHRDGVRRGRDGRRAGCARRPEAGARSWTCSSPPGGAWRLRTPPASSTATSNPRT